VGGGRRGEKEERGEVKVGGGKGKWEEPGINSTCQLPTSYSKPYKVVRINEMLLVRYYITGRSSLHKQIKNDHVGDFQM
jgi:hypothetical protein